MQWFRGHVLPTGGFELASLSLHMAGTEAISPPDHCTHLKKDESDEGMVIGLLHPWLFQMTFNDTSAMTH